jgi:hypothetical protein
MNLVQSINHAIATPYHFGEPEEVAAAVLAAIETAGWKLVPAKPTETQIASMALILDHPSIFIRGPSRQHLGKASECYAAALEFAPKPE